MPQSPVLKDDFSQQHDCPSLCQLPSICRIDTTPQSVEATFTGRHDTFQYTKASPEKLAEFVTISAEHSIRKSLLHHPNPRGSAAARWFTCVFSRPPSLPLLRNKVRKLRELLHIASSKSIRQATDRCPERIGLWRVTGPSSR